MSTGRKTTLALLALLACASANAQTNQGTPPPAGGGSEAGVPVAATDPRPEALIARAREAIASAVDGLSSGRQGQGEIPLSAAHQDTLAARQALQQAMAAAKGEGVMQDEISDLLHRAIDQISEVARSLDQLAPPVSETDLSGSLEHLQEVDAKLVQVSDQLKR